MIGIGLALPKLAMQRRGAAVVPPEYVAKGTAQTYNAGSIPTITISSVTLEAGDTLVVAMSSDGDGAAHTCAWGATSVPVRLTGSASTRLRVYALYNAAPGTANVVITMVAFVSAAAVVAIQVKKPVAAPQDQTAIASGSGTTPSSGATPTTAQANEILLGFVATAGPPTDEAGTWDNAFVAGQRTGTTGAVDPVVNRTIADGYRVVSATGAYTASKAGITSRNWAAAILTLKGE